MIMALQFIALVKTIQQKKVTKLKNYKTKINEAALTTIRGKEN